MTFLAVVAEAPSAIAKHMAVAVRPTSDRVSASSSALNRNSPGYTLGVSCSFRVDGLFLAKYRARMPTSTFCSSRRFVAGQQPPPFASEADIQADIDLRGQG
jgi:hypothetical protein